MFGRPIFHTLYIQQNCPLITEKNINSMYILHSEE